MSIKEFFIKAWPVVKTLLTHKVTYRFLAIILTGLGVSHASSIGADLQELMAVLFGSME